MQIHLEFIFLQSIHTEQNRGPIYVLFSVLRLLNFLQFCILHINFYLEKFSDPSEFRTRYRRVASPVGNLHTELLSTCVDVHLILKRTTCVDVHLSLKRTYYAFNPKNILFILKRN